MALSIKRHGHMSLAALRPAKPRKIPIAFAAGRTIFKTIDAIVTYKRKVAVPEKGAA